MKCVLGRTAPGPDRAYWIIDAPEVVYQTNVVGKIQDSASPLILRAKFADFDLTDSRFAGVVRRFDGDEITEYDEETGVMQGLRMPCAFKFSISDDELTIEVHRKYLPVSKSHGNAPFIFAIACTSSNSGSEVLVSSPFMSCSKQTAADRSARGPAKRQRGRPASKPMPAPPSDVDLLVSAHFAGGFDGTEPLCESPPAAATALKSVGSKRKADEGKGSAVAAPSTAVAYSCKRVRSSSPEAARAAAVTAAIPPAPAGLSSLLPLPSPDVSFGRSPVSHGCAMPPPLDLSRSPALRSKLLQLSETASLADDFGLSTFLAGPLPLASLALRRGSSVALDFLSLPSPAAQAEFTGDNSSATWAQVPPLPQSSWFLLRGASLAGGVTTCGTCDD